MDKIMYGSLAGAGVAGLVYLASRPPATKEELPSETTDNEIATIEGMMGAQLPPAGNWNEVGRREEAKASSSNYGCGCGCGVAISEEAKSRPTWDQGVTTRQTTRDLWESGKWHGVWAPTASAFQ